MTGPSGLICLAPLRIEALAVTSGLRDVPRRSGLGPFEVIRSGVGPRRASATAMRLTASLEAAGAHPVVCVTGVCGGLEPSLEPGQIVVADAVVGVDGSHLALPTAPSLAAALAAAGLAVRVGPILTTDRLVRGPARRALADRGAVAVDMESAVLASAPWPGPLAVVRAVVDTADAELLSTATLRGGSMALDRLRRAAPVVAAWAATASLPDRPDHLHLTPHHHQEV